MSKKVKYTELELQNKREEHEIATSARNLLEDRLTSLIEELRKQGKKLYNQKLEVFELLEKAKQHLAIAKATNINEVDYTANASEEHLFTEIKRGNVMGIRIPKLLLKGGLSTMADRDYSWFHSTSLTDDLTNNFERFIMSLVDLADNEKNVRRIGEEIRKTQRRFNALDEILIPDLDETIKLIEEGLEEQEREELAKLQVFMNKTRKS